MLLRFLLFLALLGISTAQTTAEVDAATTEPITDGPSTDAPSTDTPTDAPETVAPTTEAPETEAPSTEAPSTAAPSTAAPSTAVPSTAAPSTAAPSTEPPTTTIPPPDSLSVSCTSERMMVFLDHTKHPNLDLDKVTLKDADCKLQDYGEMNGTHFWMRVPFDSCETNHTTEGDTIIYQNSIITETRAAAGSILISREFQAEFPFKCTYPRSALVSVTSFSPRERVIYTKTAEFGNFTFTMDMYETAAYEDVYDDYPVRLDLSDPMYLEVKVTANDSQLVLIPLKCWGTPTADKDDDKYYVFIEDGCKNEEDPTLVYNYKESSVQRFELGAFRFLRESANSVVYLHCDVEACRKEDSESRCAKGCDKGSSRRKRRSLVLDAVAKQSVSIGPIDLQQQKSEEVQEQSSAGSLNVIAAVAGVLAVVVLALIVALVMLYKRYNSPQNAARVVYTKASGDDGKLLV